MVLLRLGVGGDTLYRIDLFGSRLDVFVNF